MSAFEARPRSESRTVDNRISASWLPYVELARLNPPSSWLLVFLPELFGVLHAATSLNPPGRDVLRVVAVLLAHSFFISNAGLAWNDLVDADIDARVERTKRRPVARGAISRTAACVFVCSQTVLAGACLLPLPSAAATAMAPIVVSTTYYPFAKRQMPAPQLVIGFCMSRAVIFGGLAMGHDGRWMGEPIGGLMVATVLWTVLSDTIYAHQDVVDDRKVGVKSLAVVTQGYAKRLLWFLLLAMVAILYYSAPDGGTGVAYNLITVGGCSLFTATMLTLVDLENPSSCAKWARSSFLFIGVLIASGLLANYLASFAP